MNSLHFIHQINRKEEAPWSAPYELEGLEGDKGNTMSASESMLTYRNEGTEVH